MKICTKCGENKPLEDFNKYKKTRTTGERYVYESAECKVCKYAQFKANPNRVKNNSKYQKTSKGRISARKNVLKQYGLALEDYEKMFSNQGGACMICLRPESATHGGKIKNLCVDHCHESGRTRDLLCSGCNVALGRIEDNIDTLKAMIEYLERWSQ